MLVILTGLSDILVELPFPGYNITLAHRWESDKVVFSPVGYRV